MQSLGMALLICVIIFLIGASAAAYFRKWPHNDAREQLRLIVEDRLGWTAQAIIFPLASGSTAVLFFLIARRLPVWWPRGLGVAAAILFGLGALLWLPLSFRRVQYWPQAVELLRQYDEAKSVDVNFGGSTFWPHTYCLLAAIGMMAAALAVSGTLPLLGWLTSGLVLLAVVLVIPRWQDWPPFVNYIFLLLMAIGLMLK